MRVGLDPQALPEIREYPTPVLDLYGADLSGIDLHGCRLPDVFLAHTDLSDANLGDAGLRGANLKNANLKGANLHDAKVTDEQLAAARSLRGATMPDGSERSRRWAPGEAARRRMS